LILLFNDLDGEQAQASSSPPRSPTNAASPDGSAPPSNDEHARHDKSKIYPVITQLNHTLSEIIASLDRTHLLTISRIRLNDSGSPNSFDKRRVRAQVLIPDVVALNFLHTLFPIVYHVIPGGVATNCTKFEK
jgi:chitin synthase